jgi:hypothetical protein
MLAKEIVEDNILPFLSLDTPDAETEGESTSHKVVTFCDFSAFRKLHRCFSQSPFIFVVGSFEDKTWAIVTGTACQSCNHG